MKAKIIEIRDEGTMISCLCVDMNPDNDAQRYHLRRHGYACDGRPNVIVTHAAGDGTQATNDPYAQHGRTWPTAHAYIIEHWNELADGDVVDVSYIKGETAAPKVSERFTTQQES